MAWLYVIYRYAISEWRSIRPVEMNQYDITMVTHYDITMGNDIARYAHCEITMGNDVARDIHCDITMSNDVAMCTYHASQCIMMLLWPFSIMYSLLCSMPNCVILLWVVWNKNNYKVMFDQSEFENAFVVFVYGYLNRPLDSWNIPTQTQLMCSPQTHQTLTCSCYIISFHGKQFIAINP